MVCLLRLAALLLLAIGMHGRAAVVAGQEETASRSRSSPPLQVFILAGQSNMVGKGRLGHLKALIQKDSPYRHALWNGTDYRARNDVFVQAHPAVGNRTIHGKLRANGGFSSPDCFGPELMFGWTMGNALPKNQKVLLIKTAWGGKDLAVDFRPPSAGPGDHHIHKERSTKQHRTEQNYGTYYHKMIRGVQETLANLDRVIPGYTDEDGYELRGLVWFHGWNDMLDWPKITEYGNNLEHLIRDVRQDLPAPQLPVVIGELGMHGQDYRGPGADRAMAMRSQQVQVTLRREFANTTHYVRIAPYIVTTVDKDGAASFDEPFHYSGRADNFFQIGKRLGLGMLELLDKTAAFSSRASK